MISELSRGDHPAIQIVIVGVCLFLVRCLDTDLNRGASNTLLPAPFRATSCSRANHARIFVDGHNFSTHRGADNISRGVFPVANVYHYLFNKHRCSVGSKSSDGIRHIPAMYVDIPSMLDDDPEPISDMSKSPGADIVEDNDDEIDDSQPHSRQRSRDLFPHSKQRYRLRPGLNRVSGQTGQWHRQGPSGLSSKAGPRHRFRQGKNGVSGQVGPRHRFSQGKNGVSGQVGPRRRFREGQNGSNGQAGPIHRFRQGKNGVTGKADTRQRFGQGQNGLSRQEGPRPVGRHTSSLGKLTDQPSNLPAQGGSRRRFRQQQNDLSD